MHVWKHSYARPMASILVVDDELSMREFLKILLEKEGYGVQAAAEARTALALRREAEPFDLVISDIRMPGMTGLELLAQLKAAPARYRRSS